MSVPICAPIKWAPYKICPSKGHVCHWSCVQLLTCLLSRSHHTRNNVHTKFRKNPSNRIWEF